MEKILPASMKRALAAKHAKFYTIDAIDITRKLGLGNRTNTIQQAAFFKLSVVIPIDTAVAEMKEAIYKSYYKKRGQAVVDMNNASIKHGIDELHEIAIPASWATAEDAPVEAKVPAFISGVIEPMNRQEGDKLSVATLKKYGLEDGTWPAGTSKCEREYQYVLNALDYWKRPFQLPAEKQTKDIVTLHTLHQHGIFLIGRIHNDRPFYPLALQFGYFNQHDLSPKKAVQLACICQDWTWGLCENYDIQLVIYCLSKVQVDSLEKQLLKSSKGGYCQFWQAKSIQRFGVYKTCPIRMVDTGIQARYLKAIPI